MIRITKTAIAPAVLSNAGATETSNLQIQYLANPTHYTCRSGVSSRAIGRFSFDQTIYGDETVKTQLITDQHGKCCFCEAKFSDNSFGDVEHFRPKAAYKIHGARKLTYPGYYWLAYDWDNLLYSCEKCNRAFKKNYFPLGNETTRKKNHISTNPLTSEDRMLVSPSGEDPSTYITFKEEVPISVGGSLKGSTSIKAYGLERMNDSRMEYLKLLGGLLAFCEIDITDNNQISLAMQTFKFSRQDVLEKVTDATNFFNVAATEKGKFASCVRCKFPHLPIV